MLNYKIIDNKKKLWMVLFHGIGGDTSTWNLQIDCFSKRYNLLLLDLPTHGKSSYQYKKLNRKIVNQEIKIKIATFVGLSLGTMVMANFALQYPKYIAKMILIASVVEMNWICKTVISVCHALRNVLPYKALYNFAIKLVLPNDACKEDRQTFASGFDKAGDSNLKLWLEYAMENIRQKKIGQALANTKIPMIFISGDKDTFFLGGTKKTVKAVKNAKLITMPNTAHVCNRERYKEFTNVVEEYI